MKELCIGLSCFFFVLCFISFVEGPSLQRFAARISRGLSHNEAPSSETPSTVRRVGDDHWIVALTAHETWFDTGIPVAAQYSVWIEPEGFNPCEFQMEVRGCVYTSEQNQIRQLFIWTATPISELDWVDTIKLRAKDCHSVLTLNVQAAAELWPDDPLLADDQNHQHRQKLLSGHRSADELQPVRTSRTGVGLKGERSMDLWIIIILLLALLSLVLLIGMSAIADVGGRRAHHSPVNHERGLVQTSNQPNLFHERRVQEDLQHLANQSGLLGPALTLHRQKKQREREIALVGGWKEFYQAGHDMVKARTDMLRASTEYSQLENEAAEKDSERQANIAKHQADQAKYEADAQEHRQRAAALKNPPPPEPKLTPAQQRLLKKVEIEEQLARLKAEEAEAVAKTGSEPERRRIGNMYDTRRNKLMQDLEKYL